MTQQQAARAVGVTTRTLRNWKAAPAFRRELERQHARAAHAHTSAPSRKAKAPARPPRPSRHTPRPRAKARPAAQPQRDRPPAQPSQQQTIAAAADRRARHPPANKTVCRSSRIRATVGPLGSPTTRHASSTSCRTHYTTTTTRSEVSSRQPSAALAINATTALPDRPPATKRVVLPPKRDSVGLRYRHGERLSAEVHPGSGRTGERAAVRAQAEARSRSRTALWARTGM